MLHPHVGIFWFVLRGNEIVLASRKTPWREGEDYGDFKTEPSSHYVAWPALRRRLGVEGEYEDWPRGRIVYNQREDHFIVYINRVLGGVAFRARILAAFDLPPERTRFAFDAHYSRAKFKLRRDA